MPVDYTVLPGDTLARIAASHGFADPKRIWDDAANRDLKALRGSPNVLAPDDVVVIPDKVEKLLAGATGQSHRFRARRPSLKLVLVLENQLFEPLAKAKCHLVVDGVSADLVADAKGRIEHAIPPSAQGARLIVRTTGTQITETVITLDIGHLDPVEVPAGQRARLSNLGYFAGDAGEAPEAGDPRLRSAIEEFQCDQGLQVDGICGAKTQAALKKAHGS